MNSEISFLRLNCEIENGFILTEFGFEDFIRRKSEQRQHKIFKHLLQFVIRGKGWYYLNNVKYTLEAGDLFYCPPNELLMYERNPDDPYMYYWLCFNGDRTAEIFESLKINKKNPVGKIDDTDRMFEQLKRLDTETPQNPIKLKAIIYSILDLLNSNDRLKNDKSKSRNQLVRDIIDFIQINYSQCNLRITDITSLFHIDAVQLYRTFISTVGKSAKQYLLDYRMEIAKKMILDGNSVNHTAFQCGYSDIFYFSKSFKKYYGCPPSALKGAQ